MVESLKRRIEALEQRRPNRLIAACWVEGEAEGWFAGRLVPTADIPGLVAEARAAGHEVIEIRRVIVDPPPRPEALH